MVELMKQWEFSFIDSQVKTEHLLSLGAFEIGQEELFKDTGKSNSV